MPNKENYKINWQTYSEHLREMLYNMMMSDELTDLTLVCDDKRQLKAHKIVLSACSLVFKSIINDLHGSNSVIYMRGIQHQEMESILKFMYSGEATFHQSSINEFLNLAKNLEMKGISENLNLTVENETCNEPETLDNYKDEHLIYEEILDSKIDTNENLSSKMEMINRSYIQKNSDGLFDCDKCQSQFKNKSCLRRHLRSKHEGVKYTCSQCEYQAMRQEYLKTHIQVIHEGVKYPCNHCEYQATDKSNLSKHIKSKHEGVKYSCEYCDLQYTELSTLKKHIKSKHEGEVSL